jgi:PBSX family phage portal protein
MDVNAAVELGNKINKRTLKNIKAKVVGIVNTEKRTRESGKTQTQHEDPFQSIAATEDIIEAPFDMLALTMLPENSSELEQCVEAMCINIEGFGHRQKSRLKADDANIQDEKPIPEEIKLQSEKERIFLINFFEYATEESFIEFRKRLRRDLETTGNAYFEIIRDIKGRIQSFKHIPSHQMRLSRQCENLIDYNRPILELQEDGFIKIKKVRQWKRFRRFVHCAQFYQSSTVTSDYKKRWFKEFGDPRILHYETGKFLGDEDGPEFIKPEHMANEVIHLKLYTSRSPYGLPRYIGNLLSVFGDRAAEEINYTTFRNNNIPSMLILCSGGQVTEGTIQRLESFVESSIQGSDNYSKFLIIEGEADSEFGDDTGQLKLTAQPLTKEQHDDALFQRYSENNHDKIRRCFRLPPIFVGRSDDYTRATAESSRRLADEQIFAPERDEFDELMNRVIYPEMGIRYYKFKTYSPNTTDNEQLVKILAGAEKTGGMTPRIARMVLTDILNKDIQDYFPEDFKMDVPFSLTMAEAVKNQADPSEPGQQVTALKTLEDLLNVRKSLEDEWLDE